jgi:sulfur carrier protein
VNVTINGKQTVLASGTSLGDYIDSLGRGRKGLAIAVGDTVVRRGVWDDTAIHEHDCIEILTAAQGG